MGKAASNYFPFAQKYRPKNFKQLIGQEVLTKTLAYCINNNKLANALLLSGIRGVGKTSSARIIAKTINCTDPVKIDAKSEKPATVLPCETCKNCESFNRQSHPDIIEIDAASRTSVDDVREIIESSEYKPLLGQYKIYIVDEVHMLSKNAFNAMLKTLEEPPAHVIFIFATTEIQKIPITILSRCQRYDLRRLSFEELLSLLADICQNESVNCEEEALKIIALKAEGSARDAISILDQAVSFNSTGQDSIITAEKVSKMLGLVGFKTILNLVAYIVANDLTKAMGLLEEVYSDCGSLEYFVGQIADFIAGLNKQKAIKNYHEPLFANYANEVTNILLGTPLSRLSVLWQIFSTGIGEIKASHNELITCQMLVVKATHACSMPKIEDILSANSIVASSVKSESVLYEPQNSATDNRSDNDIFAFLKFCCSENEIGLYYHLLNEVEIIEFSNSVIKIGLTGKSVYEKELKDLLQKWSDSSWSLQLVKKDQIISLKDKLLNQARVSEDFAIIKNQFPDADISDIILK